MSTELLNLYSNKRMQRKVVGYARVSTTQDSQTVSIEMQEADFNKRGCDLVIAERRSASNGGKRPGWEKLRLMVANGEVATVLIADLARLARDGSDMEFLEECAAAGTEVRDVFGNVWENQSISGLVTSGVTSLMNRVQARMIGLKAADGLRRRREAGFLARGRLPFGYKVVDSQAGIDPDNWEKARGLFELLMRNQLNVAQTIKDLPDDFPWKPSISGLIVWLNNPMLRGGIGHELKGTKYGKVEWGRAPRLITDEEYEEAMNLRRQRPGRYQKDPGLVPAAKLFTSVIVCRSCGKKLCYALRKPGKHKPRYQCKRPCCKYYGKSIREEIVKEEVISYLVKRAEDMARAALEDTATEEHPDIPILEHQLKQLEALEDQGVTGLRTSILNIKDQIATIRMMPLEDRTDFGDYATFMADVENLKTASDRMLRPIILRFIKFIEFIPEKRSVKVIPRR